MRTRARRGDRSAVDLVVERLVDPGDSAAVAELQSYSAVGNGYATELLIRVLFNLGDESAATALRAYAECGNDYAAVLLVRLLFDRGDQRAVEELRARSDAGDRYAGQRLVELLAGRQDPEAVAELRTRAEGGDRYSSQQLAETLAENGDPAAVAELRARSDAGDQYASERLVELLTGHGDPEAVSELQGRADAGDHRAAQALAYLLQRGDEHGLRAEVNAGNTADAACALANLLEGRRTTQDGKAAITKGAAYCGNPPLGRVLRILVDGLRDPDGRQQGGGQAPYRAYSACPTTQLAAIWARRPRSRSAGHGLALPSMTSGAQGEIYARNHSVHTLHFRSE